MNAKSTAAGATAAIVPGAVIVGIGLVVSTITGLQADRDHYRAEAARPRPTVTETTAAPAAGRTTVPAAPSSGPGAGAGATVVAASQPTRPAGGVSADRTGGGSGSSSAPTAQSSAGPRCAQSLSALALHECLSIGGSR